MSESSAPGDFADEPLAHEQAAGPADVDQSEPFATAGKRRAGVRRDASGGLVVVLSPRLVGLVTSPRAVALGRLAKSTGPLALVAATLVACSTSSAPPPPPTARVERASVTTAVSSAGSLSAITEQNVGFNKAGQLKTVNVKVGQRVAAGDILATLDDTSFRHTLQQQQGELDAQQAALDNLINATTVSGAQKTTNQAQDILSATKDQQSQTVDAQDSAVDRAQKQLDFDQKARDQAQDQLDDANKACDEFTSNSSSSSGSSGSSSSGSSGSSGSGSSSSGSSSSGSSSSGSSSSGSSGSKSSGSTGSGSTGSGSTGSGSTGSGSTGSGSTGSGSTGSGSTGTGSTGTGSAGTSSSDSAALQASLAQQQQQQQQLEAQLAAALGSVNAASGSVTGAAGAVTGAAGAVTGAAGAVAAANSPCTSVATAQNAVTQAERTVVQDKTAVDTAKNQRDIDQASRRLSEANAQQSVISAQNNLDSARTNRPTQIAQQRGLVTAQAALVQEAQKDVDDTVIRAPADATVSAVNGVAGEFVGSGSVTTPLAPGTDGAIPGATASNAGAASNASTATVSRPGGTQFIVLDNMDQFDVVVPFEESDATRISPDQKVNVTFDAIPDLTLPGTVVSVSPSSTSLASVISYYATVALSQTDPRLKNGQSAQASVLTNEVDDVLSVPNSAIRRDGDKSTVTVLGFDGPRTVEFQPGTVGDDRTQVLSGLTAGDEVVVPATSR